MATTPSPKLDKSQGEIPEYILSSTPAPPRHPAREREGNPQKGGQSSILMRSTDEAQLELLSLQKSTGGGPQTVLVLNSNTFLCSIDLAWLHYSL